MSDLDDLTPEEQAEYRLDLRLANRHKWYQLMSENPRHMATRRLPHASQLEMLPTFVLRTWSDGALNLRHALLILRERWTKIAGPGVPCPIEISVEERIEHEEQLRRYELYEAVMEASQRALRYEGDGLVKHESFDRVKGAIDRFEAAWDEDRTGSPFPMKDGGYSFFLS